MSVKDDVIAMDRPGEVITAVVHIRAGEGCESYSGPLVIGFYPDDENGNEVWIECEGKRVHIIPRYFKEVVRLMKLARNGVQQ